ncbi:MAG: hypothetical protein AAGG79_03755 [Pseudomonadota bacterium]
MREEFELLCLQVTDATTLVGQAYATDPDIQCNCREFLTRQGYDVPQDETGPAQQAVA